MLSPKVLPESLTEMFSLVKEKLRQKLDATSKLGEHDIRQRELQYVVAYSVARPRN